MPRGSNLCPAQTSPSKKVNTQRIKRVSWHARNTESKMSSYLFHLNIFLKNICRYWLHLGKQTAKVSLVHSLPSICQLTPSPPLWVPGQPEAQQQPFCHWALNSNPSKAACMKNRKKRKQEVIEERRLASPYNHHDIRQMEPGSRGAAAKPASCREAAWLMSLDLIGQLSAGGGEYKPVHADSFRFLFLSFTFFF